MLHIQNSVEENWLKEKSKTHTMSEKQHKINNFVNYQKIILRNNPAFNLHDFVPSQKMLIFGL